jgi:hypothetical protein
MNNLNENSANVISEKLALSRELANLKPEIEHLRSQVNHQQATLAEKLALERQVNTLEVELANEKKARKRALQSRESNDRVEDELRKKLRDVEKRLTAETAERERLEDQLEQRIRTHAMTLQEQDSTRELEADLRKKLQEAQRQLRQEKEEKERLDEELQDARRASKKSQQPQASNSTDAKLRVQLEELEENLATFQDNSAKRDQEHQAAIAGLEGRNEQLEKKLERMRTKLRETQEELKKSQVELRKSQQQQARSSASEDSTKLVAKTQVFRKRKGQEMDTGDFTNIEIPTPSADNATKARRASKKPGYEPALVGEKSTFSITPFLNRSKNMSTSDEDSKADEGVLEDSILGPQVESHSSDPGPSQTVELSATTSSISIEPTTIAPTEANKPDKVLKPRGRPKKVLGDAASAKKNALTQKAPKKVLKTKSKLEMVAEIAETEESGNNIETKDTEPAEKTTTVKFNLDVPQDESNASSLNGELPKKKKRKVLGSTKTLFDEDDVEAPAIRKPAKVPLGAKRTKAPLGVKRNAFAGAASFSPLKRDRRGVGASFLA